MFSLERKIYTLKIPFLKTLSGVVRNIFEILAKENIAVKGGFAKIILGEVLKSQGKIKKNLALGYKSETDLDLLITFSGSRKDNIEKISKKIYNLKEKFSKLGINLDEADVEALKGNLNDIEFIREFLESRDLTINEVIFIPSSETLFFTDKCLRDTINAVGILAANKVGTLKRDCGRIIASPYGIVRLIRFLIEKKVNSIYLPNWWVRSNKDEAERLGKPTLEAYGLILIERYKNKESLQLRFMKTLNDLSITNLKNFNTFKKEQELMFEAWRKKKFTLKKRSFREIQKELFQEELRRKRIERQAEKKRKLCPHKKKIKFICEYCPWQCAIIKCLDCGLVEVIPKGKSTPFPIDSLFCNKNFIEGNVYWDKLGFFPEFPILNKE